MRTFWVDLKAEGNGLKITVGKGDSEVIMSRSWDQNPAKSWPPTHVAFSSWSSGSVNFEFSEFLTGI